MSLHTEKANNSTTEDISAVACTNRTFTEQTVKYSGNGFWKHGDFPFLNMNSFISQPYVAQLNKLDLST